MPIRPENRRRYPASWKDIRSGILARAQHRCEWCGVPNYAVGYREHGDFHTIATPITYADAVAERDDFNAKGFDEPQPPYAIVIVLTIAHVHDHAPENCDPSNLAALCQRCHNRHDAPHRAAGIKARRLGPSLFEEVSNA